MTLTNFNLTVVVLAMVKVMTKVLIMVVSGVASGRTELMRRREVEVAAVMRWVMDNPFLLSLSFHDGRVLVNYPWDDSPQAVEGEKVSTHCYRKNRSLACTL